MEEDNSFSKCEVKRQADDSPMHINHSDFILMKETVGSPIFRTSTPCPSQNDNSNFVQFNSPSVSCIEDDEQHGGISQNPNFMMGNCSEIVYENMDTSSLLNDFGDIPKFKQASALPVPVEIPKYSVCHPAKALRPQTPIINYSMSLPFVTGITHLQPEEWSNRNLNATPEQNTLSSVGEETETMSFESSDSMNSSGYSLRSNSIAMCPKAPSNTPTEEYDGPSHRGYDDLGSQGISHVQLASRLHCLVPAFSSPDFRETHNAKERKRRSRIRDSCQAMRQLVPSVSERTDNATVFEHVVHYMSFLKQTTESKFDVEFLQECQICRNKMNAPTSVDKCLR